ncbi:phage major capsid protein, P2 family [Chitiniphilus purpureus]|uniref:Phage major capsid protein, P2 family n=1 Tax=Chitiniphilus purpureus TaxID=2981137 RepID=A0ABY6DY16_9NEIS|nr:phage major capsid protein, P2 family [Chitiniphilus sp. CD1]UXY16738.1 phage major capsid protein, P2 family [Chitiniphilus sp. CD1]
MRPESRLAFKKYLQQLAKLNGIDVDDLSKRFTPTPSVSQTIEKKIRESSDFLSRINSYGVRDLKGKRIGMGVAGSIASRTNTKVKARKTKDVAALDDLMYELHKTDFDTHITYEMIDQWSEFPEFQTMLRDAILEQQAADRLMIGFHGTHAAPDSDPIAFPLLQDMNIGWLQQYRNNAPERVMSEVVENSSKVKVGGVGADFKNIDALVYDAVNGLVHPNFRGATDLVVLCSTNTLADKYFPLLNRDQPASEVLASDMIISQKRMGGLQAIAPTSFPDGKLLITKLKNLSVYYQKDSRRRTLREAPEYDRIENFESVNEGYVIERFEAGCLVENIEFGEA